MNISLLNEYMVDPFPFLSSNFRSYVFFFYYVFEFVVR